MLAAVNYVDISHPASTDEMMEVVLPLMEMKFPPCISGLGYTLSRRLTKYFIEV